MKDFELDEMERLTSGADGFHLLTDESRALWNYIYEDLDAYENLQEELDEWLNDQDSTVELKCTCGSWKVFGRDCSPLMHSDWCDLIGPKS